MEKFLTYLAIFKKVSLSTQSQATSALIFMYRQVLDIKPPWVNNVIRTQSKKNIPVVLSLEEITLLIRKLKENYVLITVFKL